MEIATVEEGIYIECTSRRLIEGKYKTKQAPSFEQFLNAMEKTKINEDLKNKPLPDHEIMNIDYQIQNNFGFRTENYFVEKLKKISEAYSKGIIKDGLLNI